MSLAKIMGMLKKADDQYKIIADNDRIAVAISGGKDSIVLLTALHFYKRYSKKNYELIAININAGFGNMDFSEVKSYIESLGIEFQQIESNPNIAKVLEIQQKDGKYICSICSKMKKAAIVKYSKELNCNKIAYGHHGDDAIETLMMNCIYGGRIATFPVINHLSENDIYLIRPMVYARESDIIKTCNTLKLPIVKSTCKNDKHTQREEMKKLTKDLYKKYPMAYKNFLHMLSNYDNIELWKESKTKE